MGLVLVDLDGTLLPRPSSERRFAARLLLARGLGPTQVVSWFAFPLRHWRDFGRTCLVRNKAYLAGLPVAEVEALAADFVVHSLEPQLRPDLLRRLDRHRCGGDVLALLSGAPAFIVAPLARRLDIALWRATRCETRAGRFQVDPPARHPFAEGKLASAREICRAASVDLTHCTAYADSRYDLPLLNAVGRPVAVDPDPALARAAREKGWEIMASAGARPGLGLFGEILRSPRA